MQTSIRPVRMVLACVAPLFFAASGVAEDLATRVTTQIQESAELKQAPITVRALGPTVWLSGTVSAEQQQLAIAITEATPGVERVVNQLAIAGTKASQRLGSIGTPLPTERIGQAVASPAIDSQVTDRPVGTSAGSKPPQQQVVSVQPDLAAVVAGRLRESAALKGYRVSVKAKDGTVWLSGTLSSQEQLELTTSLVESTAGVERVVNRLSVRDAASDVAEKPSIFSLPESVKTLVGLAPETGNSSPSAAVAAEYGAVALASGDDQTDQATGQILLTQAQAPTPRRQSAPATRPVGPSAARPMPMRVAGQPSRTAVRPSGYGESMVLPGPEGHADYAAVDGLADGQMVPGSMRISDGGMAMPEGAMGMGRPMPMGAAGVGMPAVPVRGGGPNMPNYAWPSYAANPNYAAVQYPTQYSPTAWPYIGPFYPYPQVPLGWRRVSLEWDDGWWFLDFDERHVHSHHR